MKYISFSSEHILIFAKQYLPGITCFYQAADYSSISVIVLKSSFVSG